MFCDLLASLVKTDSVLDVVVGLLGAAGSDLAENRVAQSDGEQRGHRRARNEKSQLGCVVFLGGEGRVVIQLVCSMRNLVLLVVVVMPSIGVPGVLDGVTGPRDGLLATLLACPFQLIVFLFIILIGHCGWIGFFFFFFSLLKIENFHWRNPPRQEMV